MKEIEQLERKINEDVKSKLSEKRYLHSLGVMKKAEELAKIYGIDVEETRLAALAHDIAKEMPKEEKLLYAEKNNIPMDEIEKVNVGLLHGKIAADICQKEYNFTESMCKAIEYHTTGNENMDLLAKIIFVADKIEDGRKYKDEEKQKELENMRQMALENIDKALLYLIDSSLMYTIQKKELIHTDSIKTRNKIINQL